MGKIFSMLNMKGGVGKTTIAVNVASALAKLEGYEVLLIDLDPQYNATQHLVDLNTHPEFVNGNEPTVFNIMAGGIDSLPSVLDGLKIHRKKLEISDVSRNLFKKENGGKLDLIPGTLHLINLETTERGTEHRLQNFVNRIKNAYDFIIIDCPPTFSVFLLSGFLASEYYLVPLKPDPLSTLGIPLLDRVLDVYSDTYQKKIDPLGVVFTMVRHTREMRNVMEVVKDSSAGRKYVFRNKLSHSTRIPEASRKGLALFEYPRAYRYGEEIKEITSELLGLF